MPSNLDQGFGWIFEVTHDSVNGLVRKLAVIEGRDLDSCFDSLIFLHVFFLLIGLITIIIYCLCLLI